MTSIKYWRLIHIDVGICSLICEGSEMNAAAAEAEAEAATRTKQKSSDPAWELLDEHTIHEG